MDFHQVSNFLFFLTPSLPLSLSPSFSRDLSLPPVPMADVSRSSTPIVASLGFRTGGGPSRRPWMPPLTAAGVGLSS